jgi:hypothetical protein
MIYIGNYKEWIQQEWIDYLLTTNGTLRPKTTSENPDSEEFRVATSVGYDLSKTYWHHYTNTNNTFTLPLELPFDNNKNHIWWFIKMSPGQFMPMHKDPHAVAEKNVKRYWMALQDYEEGHIHINAGHFLSDYKKGDLWMYDNPTAIHGACNIGYSPRLVFNFSIYE